MDKMPPIFIENKDLLKKTVILEIRQNNDKIAETLTKYDDAIIRSQVRIQHLDNNAIDLFQNNLKKHRFNCINFLNEIENALDIFSKNENSEYLEFCKNLYNILKEKSQKLLASNFSEVNKTSHSIINLIEINLKTLEKLNSLI